MSGVRAPTASPTSAAAQRATMPAAMIVRKGGRWHRTWGRTFAWGMGVVLVSAAFMWESHGHLFLLFLDAVSASAERSRAIAATF